MSVANKLWLWFSNSSAKVKTKFLMLQFGWHTHLVAWVVSISNSRLFLNLSYTGRVATRLLTLFFGQLQRNLLKVEQTGPSTNMELGLIPPQQAGPGTGEVPPRTIRTYLSTSLPIVFIHRFNPEYLKYALLQARQSNPESPIYLLGDDSNDRYDYVIHKPISNYFQEADKFSKMFQNYNTNTVGFELFNFQRWFILKEFVLANNISKCLYLDSDTMLYADVTKDQVRFENFDFMLTWRKAGNTFFLNRIAALSDFCDFVTNIYTKRDQYHFDKMVAHFAARRKNRLPGGVCDMTAFELYGEMRFGDIGEVALIMDGSLYDPSINTPHPGLEMQNGIKKITWKGSQPYGRHVKTGKEIKINSLHCSGAAKSIMGHLFRREENIRVP